MELIPGTQLHGGSYEIVRKLGQGGFGITYLANQRSPRRQVAVKEFFMKDYCQRDTANPTRLTIPTTAKVKLVGKFKEKFINEAQKTAELSHPNIVSIIETFEENDTAYYVMPYLPGGSLAEYSAGRALPEVEALKYIRQTASALKYMHSQHKNHLDVKPGNIMLDQNGNAVLIDFGLAKVYDDTGNPLTGKDSEIASTPGYAPLEQQSAKEQFAATLDIYALGATLYKLLSGKTPPAAGLLASEDDTLTPLPDSVSASTREAIYAAMKIKKSERPQSVDEFLKILNDEATKTPAPEITTKSESETTLLNTKKEKSTLTVDIKNPTTKKNNNISKETNNKEFLWEKLKTEFAKRHIVANIVLVLCFIYSTVFASITLVHNHREYYDITFFPMTFMSLAIGFLMFGSKNGLTILTISIVSASLVYVFGYNEIIGIILPPIISTFLALTLTKNNKSAYNVLVENGSSNIANSILSIGFVLFVPLIWQFFDPGFMFNQGLYSFLGEGDFVFNNYTVLCYLILGIWGLTYILKKKWSGVIYIFTSFIILNLISLWSERTYINCFGFINGNNAYNFYFPERDFYSYFTCDYDIKYKIILNFIFIAAILIGLFWKHNGKSNFSQMTDGKGIANTKNAIKICLGVLAFALFYVFSFNL